MARSHHRRVVDVVSPPAELREAIPSDLRSHWEHVIEDIHHDTDKPGLLALR